MDEDKRSTWGCRSVAPGHQGCVAFRRNAAPGKAEEVIIEAAREISCVADVEVGIYPRNWPRESLSISANAFLPAVVLKYFSRRWASVVEAWYSQ